MKTVFSTLLMPLCWLRCHCVNTITLCVAKVLQQQQIRTISEGGEGDLEGMGHLNFVNTGIYTELGK